MSAESPTVEEPDTVRRVADDVGNQVAEWLNATLDEMALHLQAGVHAAPSATFALALRLLAAKLAWLDRSAACALLRATALEVGTDGRPPPNVLATIDDAIERLVRAELASAASADDAAPESPAPTPPEEGQT